MMLTTTPLPNPKDARDLLSDLLGRDVTVADGQPVVPGPREPVTVAVYVDDALRTAVVAVADLRLSAYAGAAIGLVPVGGAEAAIEDRELAASVRGNLDEILNVISALFNVEGAPHLRLYATYTLGEEPPSDVAALLRTIGRRLDLDVEIAGYGAGALSLVLA
jgi:hypothetical protein